MNVRQFTYEIFDTLIHGGVAANINTSKKGGQDAIHIQPEIVEAIPPAPTFSAEEIELAKSMARAEGVEEGKAEAKKQFEAAQAEKDANIDELLVRLANRINGIEKQIEARKTLLTHDFAELAISVAKQICSELPEETLTKQTEGLINDALKHLDQTQKIKIQLNPKNAARLNDKFTGIALQPVEDMAPGDFKVEWQNGYLEHDTKKLWENMQEVLSKHFANTKHTEINNEQGV